MESILSRAAKWESIWASLQVDSNCATRSAELTIFFPRPRNRSMVPPSTSEIVNTLLLGEYCMARSRCFASMAFSWSNNSCQPEYLMFLAGQGIEVSGFDLVHKFYGLAFGGNQIEPAPRDHQARRQAAGRGRRWDRGGGDRKTTTRQCCVRAAQTGWQRGP